MKMKPFLYMMLVLEVKLDHGPVWVFISHGVVILYIAYFC